MWQGIFPTWPIWLIVDLCPLLCGVAGRNLSRYIAVRKVDESQVFLVHYIPSQKCWPPQVEPRWPVSSHTHTHTLFLPLIINKFGPNSRCIVHSANCTAEQFCNYCPTRRQVPSPKYTATHICICLICGHKKLGQECLYFSAEGFY